ncbi:MAG: C40 family peptidase [Nitrospirae bacterium]|nr:C40 family peptidase [Candidatus Troglogloeales bacterium]
MESTCNSPIIVRVFSWGLACFLLLSGCAGGTARGPATTYLLDFSSEKQSLNPEQTQILSIAKGLLGAPYRVGGKNPKEGFDCSGYVAYVYNRAVGVSLPRQTAEQIKTGRAVLRSLRPGDIVYFKIAGPTGWHTGIYIGKGRFIHAPSANGVVNIQEMNLPYWRKQFFGARRVLKNS